MMAITYPVVEKFVSINGEGLYQGYPALFIRFAGCNLACSYCDTLYANNPDCASERLEASQLKDYVIDSGVYHVTLTGGEPLLQPNMEHLLESICSIEGCTVEIETNGSVAIAALAAYRKSHNVPFIFTLDYKLPGSLMEQHNRLDNYAHLTKGDAVKFVIGDLEDFNRACSIVNDHDLTGLTNVIFSPVYGKVSSDKLVEWLLEKGMMQVKVQLQIHKYIWDPQTKGV